jgi:hypothetical protein
LVTDKEFPGDFDGCFDYMDVNGHLLDPIFVDAQAQTETYGGDLSADAMSHFQTYLQTDRNNQPKGIVVINPQELLDEIT